MTKKVKMRSLLIGGVFTLFFIALVSRLYWVQVVQGADLLSQAQARWETDKVLHPVRGTIVDRNDKILAEDAPAFTVALNPQIIHDKKIVEEVVKGLAGILNTSNDPGALSALEEKIRTRLNKKRDDGSYYPQVEIRNEGWKIDVAMADQIKKMIVELQNTLETKKSLGIYLLEERKRFYPGGQLLAQVLGYTDKEGKPIMGLEKTLDNQLKGVDGWLSYEKDRYGVELPDAKVTFQPPSNGNNIRLTIDKNIQFYMENALEKVYKKYNPKSLMAVAVDPSTMEVLGMVNMPNFNPNRYWETRESSDVNHVVASQYEPGSTFKLVTLAGAVEEGLFNPEEKYQSGSIVVTDRRLHDHNITGWGKISYLEGLKRSSNVAFVKLGMEKLGQDRLRQYIDKFGFGVKTGIDLPGEVAGIINMKRPSEFATSTYGQGMTATAIQQTAAYAAIANGGKLMQPYLIKEIYNPSTGEVIEKKEPKVIRQVVSESTATQVSTYLEQVVSDQAMGTGRKAYIEGYRVAGKTGTANKVVAGEKGYAEGKWVISFIGYAPVENPKILVTIIADEPDLKGDYHLGGDVAAPAFKEIVSQSLRYMGVPSTVQQPQQVQVTEQTSHANAPDLTGQTVEEARATMNKYGVVVDSIGKGSKVIAQSPPKGTQIAQGQRMYVVLQEEGELPVPDMTGKSLRDALEVCAIVKVRCQSTGEGYVASQTTSVEGEERVVTLQLKPYNELLQAPVQEKDGKTETTAKPDSKKTTQPASKTPATKPTQPAATGNSPAKVAANTP
ncbi:penicillin-binding transpeptidase domain-containing protein [Paenibacillus sp. GD4]|uniref:penicillin-binding transpeptidase domain-containing protein n=1 Tax=Paenibacillus sp. GD4 TaxID=3068890 RepID=UPI002796700C|nr:penicillin-binding transpeptidase domain-containing protein [Paenibacillus sp. GD4]MDQ1912985.1 penicillin-binding transpeptidase domain-containing protein [Paenibacillus sp. GD4]